MLLCMKWHGAWLYGVHRTCAKMAAVSCGTSHARIILTLVDLLFWGCPFVQKCCVLLCCWHRARNVLSNVPWDCECFTPKPWNRVTLSRSARTNSLRQCYEVCHSLSCYHVGYFSVLGTQFASTNNYSWLGWSKWITCCFTPIPPLRLYQGWNLGWNKNVRKYFFYVTSTASDISVSLLSLSSNVFQLLVNLQTDQIDFLFVIYYSI